MDRAKANLDRKCGAKVACLYFRKGDQWRNLAATIVLGPFPVRLHTRSPLVADVIGFRAIEGTIGPDQVEPLLLGIRNNGVADPAYLPSGCSDRIHFFEDSPLRPYQFDQTPSFEEGRPRLLNFSWPAWRLFAQGTSVHSLLPHGVWERINLALPAASPAFASIEHLAGHIGIADRVETGRTTFIDILAPYWLKFEKVTANQIDGTITVSIRSRWPAITGNASLSMIAGGAAPSPVVPMPVGGEGWETKTEEDSMILTTRLKPTAPGPWELFLNFEGQRIGSSRTGLGRSRLVAHQLIDPECKELRDRLAAKPKGIEQKKAKRDDRFEEGVTWLLHLCGLHAARYGYSDVQQAPDVVAFLDDRGALYVECSIDFPPGEKLSKLRTRAEKFRATMAQEYQRDIIVEPLVCIPLRRSDLSEDQLENVRSERIGLLCEEDLAKLRDQAHSGEDPVRVFCRLASSVFEESSRELNYLRLMSRVENL
jgi:hypothetical protein